MILCPKKLLSLQFEYLCYIYKYIAVNLGLQYLGCKTSSTVQATFSIETWSGRYKASRLRHWLGLRGQASMSVFFG